MHIPKKTPPTRRSTQTDGWVLLPAVSIGNHTEHRSPQLNDDNMSSHQVANASAHGLSGGSSSSASPAFSEVEFDDYCFHHHHLNAAAPFVPPFPATHHHHEPPHKPESNGVSSSTETAGTDDTPIDLTTANYRPHNPTTPTAPIPFPHDAGHYNRYDLYDHHDQLTPSNVGLLQRDLALCYTSSIPGWVAGAGMGRRLLPPPSVTPSVSSMYMMAMTGSVASMTPDRHIVMPPVPQPADEDVAAAGAWCDVALGPLMRRMEVLRFEEREEEFF